MIKTFIGTQLLSLCITNFVDFDFKLPKNLTVEEAVTYLRENLKEFNVNLKEVDSTINITSFEEQDITIYDLDVSEKGKLLIFDNNQGYMLVGNESKLYDLKLNSAQPFLGIEFDSLLFNTVNGYSYIYNGEEKRPNIEEVNNFATNSSSIISGAQEAAGEGKIIDPDKYIDGKYGLGFTLKKEGHLKDRYGNIMQGRLQSDYSIYKKGLISEGNCGLVSAYAVLDFIAKSIFNDIDFSSKRNYFPETEENSLYISKKNEGIYNEIPESISFEKLYCNARKHSIKIHGTPENLTIWNSSSIIEDTLKDYNHNVNYVEDLIWGLYTLEFYKQIDAGRPLLWSTLNSETYGAHMMAVSGYRYYSKAEKWWVFEQNKTISLAQIRDGHNKAIRYFDFNDFQGIGAFSVWEV